MPLLHDKEVRESMNGNALLVYIIFVLLGMFALGVFLIMMLVAIVKKSKSLAKKACVVVLAYVSLLVIFFILDGIRAIRFDFIPQLAVDGNQMTVLNSGTGSMGSGAVYVCSEEGIIEEIDTPSYRYYMSEKFGFTFEARSEGEVYIAVIESDCGDWSYADIYEVKVGQDGSLSAEKAEHVDPISIEEFLEYLMEEYDFSIEEVKKEFGYYLENHSENTLPEQEGK